MVAAAVIGSAVVGTVGSSLASSNAAKKASNAQTAAADASIAEQRRQFDKVQSLLNPWVSAGSPAVQQMMALTGIGIPASAGTQNWSGYMQANPDVMNNWLYGNVDKSQFSSPEEYAQYHYGKFGQAEGRQAPATIGATAGMSGQQAQQQAIAGLEGSPIFQALARQGEQAMLQNASATGGLRGGNAQGALAQFRPALLNQFIEQQFQRLGTISSAGQNAAAGVGNVAQSTGANIANLYGQQGAAQAGNYLAQGQSMANLANLPSQITGGLLGAGVKF